jgi:hypothetical protein
MHADKLARARERFGRPFAIERGSDWKPRTQRYLTEWLAGRATERAKENAAPIPASLLRQPLRVAK